MHPLEMFLHYFTQKTAFLNIAIFYGNFENVFIIINKLLSSKQKMQFTHCKPQRSPYIINKKLKYKNDGQMVHHIHVTKQNEIVNLSLAVCKMFNHNLHTELFSFFCMPSQ
jgi:hypothetical protein